MRIKLAEKRRDGPNQVFSSSGAVVLVEPIGILNWATFESTALKVSTNSKWVKWTDLLVAASVVQSKESQGEPHPASPTYS